MFNCLAAVYPDDPNEQKPLLEFFELLAVTTAESLSPPENALLAALFYVVHSCAECRQEVWDPDALSVANLTGLVNDLLRKAGQSLRLQPRKVGSVLTSLGFVNRRRTSKGWKIWLHQTDRKRIHELAKIHGIENTWALPIAVPQEECPVCQEVGVDGLSQTKAKRRSG